MVRIERSFFFFFGVVDVPPVMHRGQVIHSEIIWLSHVAQVPVTDMTQSNRSLTARVEMASGKALDGRR